MSRLRVLFLDTLAWLLTRIWGHMLIPTPLGTACWLATVYWTGWIFVHWVAWLAGMLALGWFLIVVSWVRFYWNLHCSRRVD